MDLPAPDLLFPRRNRVGWFWLLYWLRFFQFLPYMLARQLVISAGDTWAGCRTANRTFSFFDGDLDLVYLGRLETLPINAIFGERFTAIRYRDVLIDPGPPFARATVLARFATHPGLTAVVVTHFHEEHIGNAGVLAAALQVPVLGSARSLREIAAPEPLSLGRRMLMGSPLAWAGPTAVLAAAVDDSAVPAELTTPGCRLRIIDAPGHCAGHIALYDPERKLLFAGDSFLHQIFTSPNRDTTTADWIHTLRRFAALDIRTLVGSHGVIESLDLPARAGVVRRRDPNRLISDKLAFLEWATAVVAAGEARGLPYGVIEACLFPWAQVWSWQTWFHDESFRLLTCGEFSRTHFVRSLSRQPERVPARFLTLSIIAERLSHHWPTLLRIHLLALRPFPVLVIAASVALSLAAVDGAAAWGHALPTAPTGAGLPWLWAALQWQGTMLPTAVRAGAWLPLLTALTLMTWWWAVVGGAITRVMALAVQGQPRESFAASLRHCNHPALALPSVLACSCFGFVLGASAWPWLLIPLLPVWLYAGFLYGAMTTGVPGVGAAIREVAGRLRGWRRLMRLQAIFLLGFATSTTAVYAVAGIWTLLTWLVASPMHAPWLGLALAAPALVYALGYTTANLKSLQVYLHVFGAEAAPMAGDPAR